MIEIKSGDYGFDISFTVTESDGVTAKNLSGYTVTFKVWDGGYLILDTKRYSWAEIQRRLWNF